MNFKKIISIILTLTMMLGIMTSTPVSVFADNSTIFEGNGFKVTYTVNSSWDKNQTIGITITNTGTETIENWAIKYDASGEISNLWNGKINKKDGTSYIIENAGYNSDIKPNQTVNFGYQLTSEKPVVPSSYSFCMKRVPKTEGYTVTFSETGGYGSDVTGNITITNTTDKPIKSWELTFESDFTINNIWNAKLISSENGKFVIKNTEDTSVIQPKSSVTFGLQCKKISEIKLNNAALSEVIVSAAADEPTEELALFAYGEYNKEINSIVLIWESSVPKGIFDVLTSSDGKDYISAVQLTDVDTYSYVVDGTSEKIFFKIKETTADNKTAESAPFIMAKTADGYELQLEDTDKDGLPDIYEKELGTDISKSDTDGDGLTDYQEVYLTGTDPLKIDTDTNEINDGDEDTDKDGLSAIKEIALGTDPSSADTDNDGLNDGDEVNNYRTDPLKYDTDEDALSDGDEVKLGLNPLSASTNGIPDNQFVISQTITADSEAFSEINTDENPYDMSLDIKAAGNVEGNITVSESGYSNVMNNDAILGVCPELVYSEDCKIDDVVLKFKVDDAYISNEGSAYAAASPEFEGIKRYNIFKYFEDINMLLPVKTEFDVANNTLYTDVDRLGTYCVIDMEKWLKGLGINADGSQTQETEQADVNDSSLSGKSLNANVICNPENTVTIKNDFRGNNTASTNALDPVKVYFIIDTREGSFSAETFSKIKENVIKSADAIFAYSKNAEVYLITEYAGLDGESYKILKDSKGNEAFTSIDDLRIIANGITTVVPTTGITADNVNNKCVISDPMKYVTENHGDTDVRTYCFNIFNPDKAVFDSENGNKDIQALKDKSIDVSVITDTDRLSDMTDQEKSQGYAVDLYKQTGGIFAENYTDFAKDVLLHIYGRISNTDYQMILATGLTSVKLKAPLNSTNGAKSDKDALTDWEEVDTNSEIIKLDANGDIIVPTFAECCAYAESYTNNEHFYVQEGLKRFESYGTQEFNEIYANIRVLPIKSDPTSVDGDKDGYLDLVNDDTKEDEKYAKITDPHPLKCDVFEYSLSNADFLSIDNGSYYGGDQGWFAGIYPKYDILWNGGCGVIAASDYIAYMNKVGYYTGCSISDINNITKNDYLTFAHEMASYLDPSMIPLIFSLNNGTYGVSTSNFQNGVKEYLSTKNQNVKSSFVPILLDKVAKKCVINEIRKQIKADKPVPLKIGLLNFVKLYRCDDGKCEDTNYHWVTITGIKEDYAINDTILYISSWGEEYYIHLNELYLLAAEDTGVVIFD
jgi:hypothetical protein